MTLKEYQEKGCERKSRFYSEARAERSAQKWSNADGRARTVYECPVCEGFHISSKMLVGYEGYATPLSIVMPQNSRSADFTVLTKRSARYE